MKDFHYQLGDVTIQPIEYNTIEWLIERGSIWRLFKKTYPYSDKDFEQIEERRKQYIKNKIKQEKYVYFHKRTNIAL